MSPVPRILSGAGRSLATRSFHTSARRMASDTPLPAKKPVGAFRGGLFGFLLGTTLSGSAVYGYVVKEYKDANEMLTVDIYGLQASVERLQKHVQNLETKIPEKKK